MTIATAHAGKSDTSTFCWSCNLVAFLFGDDDAVIDELPTVCQSPLAELAGKPESIAAGRSWSGIEQLAPRIDNKCVRVFDFISRRTDHLKISPARPSLEA
jgi:hypothetical protein